MHRTFARAAIALSLAALACSSKPDKPELPQPTVLTRSTAEPVGGNCLAGGVRIDAGLDDGTPSGIARNGVLEDGEIDTTLYVCDAPEALVLVTPEAPGVHCAAGGSRVDAGVDDGAGGGIAADGLLETGEIRKTSYVCNGATPGGPGACAAATGGAFDVAAEVSTPSNGQFFTAGERPAIDIRLFDPCGNTVPVESVGLAHLYVAGPRRGATRTAAGLLNCVTDRQAPDRQHHFVDLVSPDYADTTQQNLSIAPDGLLTYVLAPVSGEVGTYTAGIWAKSADGVSQHLVLADFQIGTSTIEPEAAGASGATSTCAGCHLGADAGRMQMAHSFPGFAPLGDYAVDQAPLSGCKLCHNADGYSPNPLVRKVHGVHRGARQTNFGIARPELGLDADPTLADYGNVVYPALPDGEKDCTTCHADASWTTAPSRLACGSCHDDVFFETGTLDPARDLGVPSTGPCTADADCTSLGGFASCDTGSGRCERLTHVVQTNDADCAGCHTADASGESPIQDRHEIISRTRVRGLQLANVSLSGGSGDGGAVLAGDMLTLGFRLLARDGSVVTDLKTNSALSATAVIGGPTDAPQRAVGPLTMKSSGTLTFDSGTGTYTYALPAPFPAQATAPYNSDPTGFSLQNGAGTYRLYLYVNDTVTVGTRSARGAASALVDFPVEANDPVRGRDVVAQAACDACHVELQAHGGARRAVGGCSTCHTAGAVDRTVGARGIACTSSATCPGAAEGWEACMDTNADGRLDACVMTGDPTPGASIDLGTMIHRIHSARLLGDFATRAALHPDRLQYVGAMDVVSDFSDALSPVDLRNCRTCHRDAATACSYASPCGVGQTCTAGRCVNTSWTVATSQACLSCHDTATAAGHAALETWADPSGPPVETCDVCHGPGGATSVAAAHALNDPFRPPQPREP